MFFKKKSKSKDKQLGAYERLVPIGASHQAVGLRPLGYVIPDEFEAFSEGYAQNVEDLIAKAKPDMYNKEYCKSIIDAEKYKVMAQLENQRASHVSTNNSIKVYQESEFKKIDADIARYKSLIQELQESLS